MAYATAEDLGNYLGHEPPSDAGRLLKQASLVIDYFTGGRSRLCSSEEDTAALRDATCAQVEFWLKATGEEHAVAGATGQVSVSGVSYEVPGQLAPRARYYLMGRGLMNRAVRLK